MDKIIEDLNIEIPHIPIICVDSISESFIVIHWDVDTRGDENLYYIVIINGQEAATLTSTSCKLRNLVPKQMYRIEIVASNTITNFKSKSEAIYVEACDKSEIEKLTNVETLEAEIIESNLYYDDDITEDESSSSGLQQLQQESDQKNKNCCYSCCYSDYHH